MIIEYHIKYPKTLEAKEAKYIKRIFGYSSVKGEGVNTIKLEATNFF